MPQVTEIYGDASIRLREGIALGLAVVRARRVVFTMAQPLPPFTTSTAAEMAALRRALEEAEQHPAPTVVYSDAQAALQACGYGHTGEITEYADGRRVGWLAKSVRRLGQIVAHDAASMLALRLGEDAQDLRRQRTTPPAWWVLD